MALPIPSDKTRQYVYNVITAVIPVLVIVGVVHAGDVSLWLNLAAAALGLAGSAQAAVALTQQRKAQARKRAPRKTTPRPKS